MSESLRGPKPAVDAPHSVGVRPRLSGLVTLLLFGADLARKGVTPFLALATVVLSVVVGFALVSGLSSEGPSSPFHDVPVVVSSALAWGGGFLLAFGSSVRALRTDERDGIRYLLSSRVGPRGYLLARIGGLAVLLAVVLGASTLIVGTAALIAAPSTSASSPSVVRALVAALVYVLAFSVVMAPVSFAVMAPRSRSEGYFFFVAVVLVPSILADSFGRFLPPSLRDVIAIPSALATLRDALGRSGGHASGALRATAMLTIYVVLSVLSLWRNVRRFDHRFDAEPSS